MFTGADLKAFRTFAGIPSYKIANKLKLPFAQIMELEESSKVNLNWLTFRWLWLCRLYTLPSFFYQVIDPGFFTQEANNQLIGYCRYRVIPGLLLLLSLLPFYLIYLISHYYLPISEHNAYNYSYCCICLFVLCLNRNNPNIVSLVLILLMVRGIEFFVFTQMSFSGPYAQYYISALYLPLDFFMVVAIALRPAFCRWFEAFAFGRINSDYHVTRADMLIGAIYQLYIWISLFTLGEHILRHLDHIGLPFNQWLYENARFFWIYTPHIKLPLNILEFVALISTINWRLARYQA